jgi:hypothetical protein
MMQFPFHSTSSKQGFTLVEVLVSSFLTLIILGMLFSVLIGTMNAWEGATSKLESSSDTQVAMDLLKSDLSGMVVRQTQYNQEWLYSGPYEIPGTGITNTWMAFLTPSIDRDVVDEDGDPIPGSIVGVSYRTAFWDPLGDDDENADSIFGLYKMMEDPQETFVNILGEDPLVGSGGYWTEAVDSAGFLMPHVVRFAVTWLVRDPAETDLVRYDETYEIRLTNVLRIDDVIQPGATLEAAEITITTISNEGMQRFRFFEGSGNEAGALSRIIRDFGRTNTIRVPIHY